MTLRIDVLSLFPETLLAYAGTSVLGRARQNGVWELVVHDFRDAATGAHRSVDDTPYGGGAGMVLSPEPIARMIEETADLARPVIAFTASGTPFTHRAAQRLAGLAGFTLLCGRYEGFDQRVLDAVVDEEISLGDFVLAGGELAALCVIEAVVRLVPGGLGNDASSIEESFADGLLEHPHFTKPATWRGREVPAVLRSGDHGAIARWRRAQALALTVRLRPDLIERRGGLTPAERVLVEELGEVDPPAGNG